jgi:hypothetical protein
MYEISFQNDIRALTELMQHCCDFIDKLFIMQLCCIKFILKFIQVKDLFIFERCQRKLEIFYRNMGLKQP